MAVFTIGGVAYDVPPLKFKAMKAAWAVLQEFTAVGEEGFDVKAGAELDSITSLLTVVRTGLEQKRRRQARDNVPAEDLQHVPTIDELEDDLAPDEFDGLGSSIFQLLRESGMMPEVASGEPAPEGGEAAGLSTATSTD